MGSLHVFDDKYSVPAVGQKRNYGHHVFNRTANMAHSRNSIWLCIKKQKKTDKQ